PEVRAAALGAVCAIEQEAAVSAVLPFLDVRTAPEAVVRAAACVALIRHAGIDGVLAAAEPLNQLLAAVDPRDRAAAADALGNIGVRGFFRPLLVFLCDPENTVRRMAIAAAGKLRAPELILAIVEQFQRRETARVDRAAHAELSAARTALAIFKKLPLRAAAHAPRGAGELLAMALLEERDARVLQALVLLQVLLPDVRLDVVAEYLRSESAAARGNAIEVLDNTLPEPWNRQVMATLDETKRR